MILYRKLDVVEENCKFIFNFFRYFFLDVMEVRDDTYQSRVE